MVETFVPVADVKFGHRTVKRIREAANIRERHGQATTPEARIMALLDIRLVGTELSPATAIHPQTTL